MVNRLRTEGVTPDTVEYLKCENDEYAYEWAITEKINEEAKDAGVPDLWGALEREAIEILNSLQCPKDNETDN